MNPYVKVALIVVGMQIVKIAVLKGMSRVALKKYTEFQAYESSLNS